MEGCFHVFKAEGLMMVSIRSSDQWKARRTVPLAMGANNESMNLGHGWTGMMKRNPMTEDSETRFIPPG